MNFLEQAIREAEKRSRILAKTLKLVDCGGERKGFKRRLEEDISAKGYALIAEYKRCAPGRLVAQIEPWRYRDLLEEWASAYSVLVEPYWFCGSYELIPVFASRKPVLYKDFVVSEVQLEYAKCLGASAALLIAKALPWERLDKLYEEAKSLGLDVLIETTSGAEAVDVASSFTEALVGINARDLESLKLDFDRLVDELRRASNSLPRETILVAESGVTSASRAVRAVEAGAKALLVGTALMKRPELAVEIDTALRRLKAAKDYEES